MSREVELYELCSKYITRQISKSTTYIYCTCGDPADRNKLYCVIANPHRITRTLCEKLFVIIDGLAADENWLCVCLLHLFTFPTGSLVMQNIFVSVVLYSQWLLLCFACSILPTRVLWFETWRLRQLMAKLIVRAPVYPSSARLLFWGGLWVASPWAH